MPRGRTWEWPVNNRRPNHSDRQACMRVIPYALLGRSDEPKNGRQAGAVPDRQALSVNISPGGMLLMMEEAPLRGQRLTISAPAYALGRTPSSTVEVCWTRPVPESRQASIHLVGVRFLRSDP